MREVFAVSDALVHVLGPVLLLQRHQEVSGALEPRAEQLGIGALDVVRLSQLPLVLVIVLSRPVELKLSVALGRPGQLQLGRYLFDGVVQNYL